MSAELSDFVWARGRGRRRWPYLWGLKNESDMFGSDLGFDTRRYIGIFI